MILVAAAFLAHSVYSAREVYRAGTALPRDILIEACVGVVLLVASYWRKLTFKPATVAADLSERELRGQNPFTFLDTRPNFQNLAQRRKQFLEWKQSPSAASSGR